MTNALLFVALSFASYRLWRLIGKDEITAPLRAPMHGKLLELVTCEWCLGTWLSFAAVYSTHRWLVVLKPHWLLWAVAVSCAVGLLGTAVDR